ncbi:MAG: hypothetical protein HYY90_04105 [Candidatus Omnitrophica bacterium]|nr:hypothetical protein [Candidatus Omnitrophota bacterium]MBI3083527.1 hypothetical protein [Candidatus Omnitrophota bacterium]
MGWLPSPELSKKCKQFVISHWGKDGLEQVMERPVSWVRHEANPHLKHLRRKRKDLPLIAVRGSTNRIHLALSTEKKGGRHV